MPEAAPSPLLGPLDEMRPHGVAVHISHESVEVFLRLYRNRLVAALVDGSFARGLVRDTPTCRVSGRQPVHESGQLTLVGRLDDEVEVIAHRAELEERNRVPLERLEKHYLECFELLFGVEQQSAARSSIDDMKHQTRDSEPSSSRHADR